MCSDQDPAQPKTKINWIKNQEWTRLSVCGDSRMLISVIPSISTWLDMQHIIWRIQGDSEINTGFCSISGLFYAEDLLCHPYHIIFPKCLLRSKILPQWNPASICYTSFCLPLFNHLHLISSYWLASQLAFHLTLTQTEAGIPFKTCSFLVPEIPSLEVKG